MGRKSRTRKSSQSKIKMDKEETQSLLEKGDNKKVILIRRESNISTVAPRASDTEFGDVPVLTICAFCDQKIVTKTHFDKKKKICFCCCVCHPTLSYIFKDVIHSCPKCNEELASYNRFLFCFRGFKTPKKDKNNNNKNDHGKAKKTSTQSYNEVEYKLLEDVTEEKQDGTEVRQQDLENTELDSHELKQNDQNTFPGQENVDDKVRNSYENSAEHEEGTQNGSVMLNRDLRKISFEKQENGIRSEKEEIKAKKKRKKFSLHRGRSQTS